ncbi:MAG: aspartate/glutamate racemase family protein [Hyphomicrobium sp.]|nr:aspartate/glutamate racemase family protein [Hyphomicrobium sp.]
MIGVFDSGLGGLTILRTLVERFPGVSFVYLGDHAHVPYGNRPSAEIVDLTAHATDALFRRGAKLVVLGCNTATAVAARHLQRVWLPTTPWAGSRHNVIGIVAPTVEAATQTPWSVTTPQYPQKNLTDRIAVFGTTRTIQSGVYAEEIRKRCPKVTVVQQICSDLAGAIENAAPEAHLEQLVIDGIAGAMAHAGGLPPHRAILGCTHFPLVEHLFHKHLPPATRILSQPEVVADSLDDYLARHPHYTHGDRGGLAMLTTGEDIAGISARARIFWTDVPAFAKSEPIPV